ncbi:MAG: hypothetical protein Q9198_009534, partial [Flavoplaca austrocitrina]
TSQFEQEPGWPAEDVAEDTEEIKTKSFMENKEARPEVIGPSPSVKDDPCLHGLDAEQLQVVKYKKSLANEGMQEILAMPGTLSDKRGDTHDAKEVDGIGDNAD